MENLKLNVLNDFIKSNSIVIPNHGDIIAGIKEINVTENSQPVTHLNHKLIDILKKEAGEEAGSFIQEHISFKYQRTIMLTSKKECLIEDLDFDNIRSIINLQEVNKHENINQFFRSINKLLPDAGMYIGCLETYEIRKERMQKTYGNLPTEIFWPFDFIFNRIMPRIKLTAKLHNLITRSSYRVISLAEVLGRLIYSGFEIIEFKRFHNTTYFVVMKTKPPLACSVSIGPVFKMNRIGKDGKMIKVYKLRTMHPYSEFLHNYIIKLNGFNEYGKVKNDFRVTTWSGIIRKLYLDEIPQLINVIKGDMNLIGVRPLSEVSFNLLPEDLKKERIKYKPGCIPPYIALKTKGLDGVLEAERKYLKDMKKGAFKTNVKYLFMAIYNLLCFRVSSN